METTKEKQKNSLNKFNKTRNDLTCEAIVKTIELVDELKYCENEKYDEVEKLIKQGLYLIKFLITTN